MGRALLATFNELTAHGYDMTWYGRSGISMHPAARPGRREIQKKWPEHVQAYESSSSRAEADRIFGGFSANLWIGNLVYLYFQDGDQYEGMTCVNGDWRDKMKWWEPPEMRLFDGECQEG